MRAASSQKMTSTEKTSSPADLLRGFDDPPARPARVDAPGAFAIIRGDLPT
ncbi:MAG: hypothetical protein QN131_10710 [Armatimonadota bacterium]|nr:hypothetical protein [Armatimonadota bacterium]